MIPLTSPRLVKFIETESRMNLIVVKAWRKVEGREMESDCLMGSEFQFCKMKKLWRRLVVTVAQHCEGT